MSSVTIQQAQEKLPELIDHLAINEELVITRDDQPIAKLVRPANLGQQPIFGRGQGKVLIVSEDEDHLKDFEEYLS